MAVLILGSGITPVIGTREFEPIPSCDEGGGGGISFASGDANDFVITSTGIGNEIQGEDFLQFDGNTLLLEGDLNMIGGTITSDSIASGVTENILSYDIGTGLFTYNPSGGGTTSFLRADGTWAAPSGEIVISGTPADNYVAVWTDANTLEGTAAFIFSAGVLTVNNALIVDTIDEFTGSAGVTIEGVIIEDSEIGSPSANVVDIYSTIYHVDNVGVYMEMDGSNNLTFTDSITGTKTLAELAEMYVHPNHTGQVTSFGDGATNLTVNAITDQTNIGGSLGSTDEFLISTGAIRRMDTSVLQTYMEDNISYLAGVDTIQFNTGVTPGAETEGLLWWNDDDWTLNIATGEGPVLQVGQETYVIVHNGSGALIENGSAIYPVGGYQGRPSMDKANAETHVKIKGVVLVATMDIPINDFGIATQSGKIRGLDTQTPGWGLGDTLWVSPDTDGELINVRPVFPNYAIQVGGVTVVDTTEGVIQVEIAGKASDTVENFWNGVFRESFDFLVTESGGTVTGSLSPSNGNVDMTMIFSDEVTLLDTDPAATIVLTPGTDTVPVTNFVYIPQSTKVLTVNTSDWPITVEHIKVANIVLQSATTTGTDGALKNQNWNDHIQSTTTNQGHLSHITEKLRKFEAQWDSGTEAIFSLDTGPTPDDIWVSVTSGVVYQMHRQVFPEFDTETGDDFHVMNDFVTPYTIESNLNTLTDDALGNSLNNSSCSFVLWGVANKTGEASHLMINLPTGSYSRLSPDEAVEDANNYSVYEIPRVFQGTGFLIARVTVTQFNNVWSVYETEDLRGAVPNTSAGGGVGGGGVTTFLALSDVPGSYIGEALNITRVNAGETALEFAATTDWDTAYTHSQIVTGNPHVIGYADIADFSTGVSTYETSHTGLVDLTGTPANNQIAVWIDVNTIEGDSDFTFDTSNNRLLIGVNAVSPFWKVTSNGSSTAMVLQADRGPQLQMIAYHNDADQTPYFTFQKYGGTSASPAAASTDAEVFQEVYQIWDGSGLRIAGEYIFQVDGVVATNDFDTKYTWSLKEGATPPVLMVTLGVDGFEYNADHATDQAANDRWIPDKKYVDDAVGGGGGMIYPGVGIALSTGSGWDTSITDNSATWDAAQAGHANLTSLSTLTYASVSFVKMTAAGTFALDTNTYLTSETSHADVLVDGDFTSQGIMLRGGSAGVYAIVTTSSAIDTVETTLTDDDTHLPTSGAVYGAIAGAGGMVYPGVGIALSTGSAWDTSITDNSTNWNTAYSHSQIVTGNPHVIGHADIADFSTGVSTHETSHATVLVDADFGSAGLMATDGAGSYSIVTDNSSTWDVAQPGHANLTSLAALSYASVSFVKMTAAGTFALDTATYNNYSHPNHTGHVTSTGDGATVVVVAAITEQTALTTGLDSNDELLVQWDGNIRRMDISVLQTYMQSNLTFSTAMVYPDAGIALSTGSAWGTSIVNNSSTWNTAYGWGDHDGLYDTTGTAAAAVSSHESTYNHSNYNTAYSHSQVSSGNPHSVTYAELGGSQPAPISHTLLSHTISGETLGHVLAADSATTYSIRELLGSEISNDLGWVTTDTTYTFQDGLTEAAGTVSLGGTVTDIRYVSGSGSGAGTVLEGTYTANNSARAIFLNNQIDLKSYGAAGYVTTSGYAHLGLSSNTASIGSFTSGVGHSRIVMSSSAMSVQDDISSIGLRYSGDYSTAGAALGDRWIPDKAYVDSVAGTTINFGAATQVPFMNGGGDDFSYDNDYIWNSSQVYLTIGGGSTSPTAYTEVRNTGIRTYAGAAATYQLSTYSNTATQSSVVTNIKYGGSIASPITPATNTEIGRTNYYVYDGTALRISGEHLFKVDGAISTNDFDTEYEWWLKEGASANALMVTLGVNGFEYAADHSTDQAANDRWIPDKGYVDSVAGGGGIAISGTPSVDQIGVWAGAASMLGDSDFIFNGTTFTCATATTLSGLGDDDAEDHLVAIDDSTGVLSKRSVASLGSSSYTFDSGLTEVAGNVDLGGALSADVDFIGASTYDFNIGSAISPMPEVTIHTDEQAQIRCVSGGTVFGYVTVQSNAISMNYQDGDGQKTIAISPTSMYVLDNNDEIGLQYSADYSTNGAALGDRWIPDKGYVDSIVGVNYGAQRGDIPTTNTGLDGFEYGTGLRMFGAQFSVFGGLSTFTGSDYTSVTHNFLQFYHTGIHYIRSGTSGGYQAFVTNNRASSEANSNLVLHADQTVSMPGLGDDDTEDHVIAIDDSTGLLSKRSVASLGGGGGLWTDGGAYVYVTSGDNIRLPDGENLEFGGTVDYISGDGSTHNIDITINSTAIVQLSSSGVGINETLFPIGSQNLGAGGVYWNAVHGNRYYVDNAGTYLDSDGSNNMTFTDTNVGTITLASLVKEYASFYLSTGGVTGVSTAATTLTVNQTSVTSDSGIFVLSSSIVTINKTGIFEISWDCYFNTAGTARSEYTVYLDVDQGGGYTDAPGTRSGIYARGYDSGATGSGSIIMNVTTGDTFRLRVIRTAGTATDGYQDDNGTRFSFKEV